MVFSCAAVCTDLKTTRVPNGLIVLGILAGVMLSLMGIRSGGVVLFLIRLIWPVALLYPIYLIRGLGAGDIKCFAALSVILGSRLALSVIIYSLIIGAVIGFADGF
ncbi:prepilin peptidase [Roseburia sp. AM51-8]|uniref:prepilin peptidase n=1 Tax=Roseburia sp. AM51-8 TaxID=2292366 RepID=UPI001FA96EF0|nr:prepilin peptidase [Roseburia sp. AM51-8]